MTPYELFVALGELEWGVGNYELDLSKLVETGTETRAEPDEGEEDAPVWSTITGQYRNPKRYGKGTFISRLIDTKAHESERSY